MYLHVESCLPSIFYIIYESTAESSFTPSFHCNLAFSWWLSHSVQWGINLPLENYPPPLIGQLPSKWKFSDLPHIGQPPLPKMKIFWPPPNFCSFPDFLLEESIWHAINLWCHWKACSFTRAQNHSSNHLGVIKNFIFIKWHYTHTHTI